MNFNNSIDLRERKKKLNPKAPIERFNIAYVIKKGYFNLVRYLLNIGADPNVRDRDKNSSKRFGLIYCTFIEDEKWALNIAQNLLECGAYLRNKDEYGLTALHYCAAFGLSKLLKLFMESLDFDLTKELDNDGNNVLHYAVKSQNVSCINVLLEKCQQSHINGLDKMTNNNGYTALEFISNYSYKNISTPLVSQNDFFESISNSADNKSRKLNDSKLESKSTFFQTELNLDDNFRSEINESCISHSQSTIGDENRYFFVNSYEIEKTASTNLFKENKQREKECNTNNNDRKIRKNSSYKKGLIIEKNLRTLKLIRYNATFFKKEYLFKVSVFFIRF